MRSTTSLRPRGVGLALLAAAGLGLIVALARPAQPGAAPQSADAKASAPPKERASAPRWDVDTVTRYELDFEATMTAQDKPVVALNVAGQLAITPLAHANGHLLRCELDGAFRSLRSGDGATVVPAEFQDGLKQPWYAELDSDGKYVAIRHQPGLPEFVVRVWQTVASTLQVSRSALTATSAEVQERDSVGVYRASYARTSPGAYVRRKLDYVKSTSTTVQYELSDAQAQLSFDAAGHLTKVHADERVHTLAQGAIPVFGMTSQLQLSWLGQGPNPLAQSALRDAAQRAKQLPADVPLEGSSDGESIDQARIGGRSYAEVIATLLADERAVRGAELSKEQKLRAGRAYMALTALLRREPAHLSGAKQHIEQGGPLQTTLIDALRDANTPEAQHALAELMQSEKLTPVSKFAVMRGLSLVSSPSTETVATLRALQWHPQYGVQATYGLGSSLHRLGQQPEFAASVRGELVARLGSANGDTERAMVLTALGNAGDAQTLDTIAKYLDPSFSAAVRAAAVQGLRRVPGELVDVRIAAVLQDGDVSVRASAINALSERSSSAPLVAALSQALQSETSFEVRASAAQTAASWLSQADALREPLAMVATSDPDENIRRIAHNALSGGRDPG